MSSCSLLLITAPSPQREGNDSFAGMQRDPSVKTTSQAPNAKTAMNRGNEDQTLKADLLSICASYAKNGSWVVPEHREGSFPLKIFTVPLSLKPYTPLQTIPNITYRPKSTVTLRLVTHGSPASFGTVHSSTCGPVPESNMM